MQVTRKEDYNTRHRMKKRGVEERERGWGGISSYGGGRKGRWGGREKEYDVAGDHPDRKAGGQHQRILGLFLSFSHWRRDLFPSLSLANEKKKSASLLAGCGEKGKIHSRRCGGMGYLILHYY